MRVFSAGAVLLGLAQLGASQGQDLLGAIANDTRLTSFAGILKAFPNLVSNIVPQSFPAVTILIPSNTAFDQFVKQTGQDPTSLPLDKLMAIFQYHVMAAGVTSKNFTLPRGIVVPTFLKAELYNNRTAGDQLVASYGQEAAQGNVLYISKDPINPAKLKVRQSGDGDVNLRGGLGGTSTVHAVDGKWIGGYYQIIDSILSPPSPCSNTIRTLSGSLSGLDTALNRSGLWTALDHAANVTCLAPNNAAFKLAGSPEMTLNTTALSGALLFHTLPMVTYSTYLTDGMIIQSLAGLQVTVKMVGNDIYFNDAKVVSQNVVTNNGLIHVLDKVMSPNGTAPGSPTSTSTSSSSPTGSATSGGSSPSGSNKPNSASGLSGSVASTGLLAFVAAAMLFL